MEKNNEEELKENIDSEKKENNTDNSTNNKTSENDVYIPEQLEDEEFEKEKNKIKEEKAAKKAEKKAKKQSAKENIVDVKDKKAYFKKRKQRIITIAIIVAIIVFILVGIAGYLIYAINRPENAIEDFVSYINEEDWNNAMNQIDMQGYMTMSLIDLESQEDSSISYTDYESKYDNVYNELEDMGYGQIIDILEYGEENNVEILENLFAETSFVVNSIDNVERIGDTRLYKITVNLTITDDTGTYSDKTETYEMYVAKKDGEYKIVGGTFPAIIYYYYQYNYAYSSYYTE